MFTCLLSLSASDRIPTHLSVVCSLLLPSSPFIPTFPPLLLPCPNHYPLGVKKI